MHTQRQCVRYPLVVKSTRTLQQIGQSCLRGSAPKLRRSPLGSLKGPNSKMTSLDLREGPSRNWVIRVVALVCGPASLGVEISTSPLIRYYIKYTRASHNPTSIVLQRIYQPQPFNTSNVQPPTAVLWGCPDWCRLYILYYLPLHLTRGYSKGMLMGLVYFAIRFT